MKNLRYLLIALMLVLGIIVLSIPQTAQAKSESGPGTTSGSSGIAEGAWGVTTGSGSDYDVTKIVASAPKWLQLLDTNGIKLTKASKICHPLRGGPYGWIGQIYQYKDGKWTKMTTVDAWVPNNEGIYMSCAEAPSAGIYALFGYYVRPANYVESSGSGSTCSSVSWDLDLRTDTTFIIDGYVYGVPDGTTISMVVDSSEPTGLTGSSSDTVDSTGNIFKDTGISSSGYTAVTVTYTESAHGCTHSQSYTFGPI